MHQYFRKPQIQPIERAKTKGGKWNPLCWEE